MAVKNESWTTSSLEERETIISYDRLLDRWHIWTDEPKHARKYEKYIDEQQPTRKGYNPKNGQLVMLEGDLINVNVIITKKRTYKMTPEQKAEKAKILSEIRQRNQKKETQMI
ncbi:hypothetical protein ACLUXQ_05780 [Limosilactobacillus mucosae]